MGIRAHKPHTIHIIHPTSVIIMNLDVDPNRITGIYDSLVYQSIYNCQQNNNNCRRREKEEQFLK